MNRELPDEVLIDYLLGHLNKDEIEKLEQRLREEPDIRNRVFRMQASIEDRVLNLDVPETMQPTEFNSIKQRTFAKIGIVDESTVQETESSVVFTNRKRQRDSWLRYVGGAAAVVLFAFLSVGLMQMMDSTRDGFNGPSLVVYDIVDEASMDLENIKSGGNIREVLYINDKNVDRLSRAEAYAEQLWQEYLSTKEASPDAIKTSGFVVLDLEDERGFAGFYDNFRDVPVEDETLNTLWLADHSVEKPVSVNPVKPESGVFYFRLKKGEVELSTLNQFVPISKPSAKSEI